jgi:hypothetical protein
MDKPWLVYLLITCLLDFHFHTTKSASIYKTSYLIPLLYVPFLALTIYTCMQINEFGSFSNPHCLRDWQLFVRDMLAECSFNNLKNLLLIMIFIITRLIVQFTLQDKKVWSIIRPN